MKKTKRHNIEGAVLDIPLRYDELAGMDIEEYPDLTEHPVYTPAGERVMLTIEDACLYGETADGTRCIDCGSCVHYRQAPDTLLGVCGHAHMRIGQPAQVNGAPEGENATEADNTRKKGHEKEESEP